MRRMPAWRPATANKGLADYQLQLRAEGALSAPSAVETLRVLDRALLTLGRDSGLRHDYLRGRWQRLPRSIRGSYLRSGRAGDDQAETTSEAGSGAST